MPRRRPRPAQPLADRPRDGKTHVLGQLRPALAQRRAIVERRPRPPRARDTELPGGRRGGDGRRRVSQGGREAPSRPRVPSDAREREDHRPVRRQPLGRRGSVPAALHLHHGLQSQL